MSKSMYLYTILLLLSSDPSIVTSLQKRSDDVSLESVVTLVQQQAATISSQQARIDALQARLSVMETSMQQQAHSIADVTSNLNGIATRMNTRISFTAHMTRVPVTVTDTPFLFDAIVSNYGNGYNPQSGIFSAPVAGSYVFYTQIQNHAGSDRTDFAIAKDNQQLCANELDQVANYDKASCFATTHLLQGERVFVRRLKIYGEGHTIEGNFWSSFSGQLISADP